MECSSLPSTLYPGARPWDDIEDGSQAAKENGYWVVHSPGGPVCWRDAYHSLKVSEQHSLFDWIGCVEESSVNYVTDILIGTLGLFFGYGFGSKEK